MTCKLQDIGIIVYTVILVYLDCGATYNRWRLLAVSLSKAA